MSEDITLEAEKKKYLGKEATEKLIKNIKSKVNNALADKVSFNEQTLTNEQQEQVRKNIGVIQADHAQNDKYAVDYIKNRLAYTEENLITVCFGDVDNSPFTVSGVGFSHVSDLVPTKEQLVGNMRFYLVDQFGEESESHNLYIKEVIFDDDMVYGGALYYGNDVFSGMYMSVAYKSGVWNGMEIPKTGLFIHKPDLGEADPNAYFELKYEAVHGVDPKYLPEGGFGYLGKEGYVKVLDSSDVGEKIESSDTTAEGYLYSKNILKEGNQYRVSYMDDVYEITCVRVDTSNGTILVITGNGFSVGEGIVEGELVRLIECGIGGIETIVIEEWQSEVHKIDPMFIPDDFGGYWFDDINFVYALLGTGGQAGKLEYTLAPAVYDSMAKAIQDGTFKGVLFSMEGQTMRLMADTGLSYLNGVSEFVLNVPTGITDEHMTYDKIVVRLIEDGTVLVDYVDDERDIVIDMTDIFQEEVVPYRLYTERAQLLDHFAKKHRSITCAVDIGGYIHNVTLSYSSSEYSTQYVGSCLGYVFVITFADGAWEAVKLREGVGILETSLPKDGSKVMLSEKDILYLTGAMEMNVMGPINVYINVEGEGACIAPMKIYHHIDGSEIMCVETSTKRCFLGETEEGICAWAEDLIPDHVATKDDIEDAKAYAKSLRVAFDGYDTIVLQPDIPVETPFDELVGLEVVDVAKNRRLLANSIDRPDDSILVDNIEVPLLSLPNSFFVSYHTCNGALDKKCLFFMSKASSAIAFNCPSYKDFIQMDAQQSPLKNSLMYVFEETHYNGNPEATLSIGWYAANSRTFECEPFDADKYPFYVTTNMLEEAVSVSTNSRCSEKELEYLKKVFPLREKISYTVTENNIFEYDGGFFITYCDSSSIRDETNNAEEVAALKYAFTEGFTSFVKDGSLIGRTSGACEIAECIISYPVFEQVDPKFIPDTIATKEDVVTAVSETKEYIDRICRIEKTIFTWDGDRTGKTVVGDDYFTYVRLYSAVAPETITKAAVMTIGGAVEYTADAFTITELSGTGYAISINSIIGILVVPEDCDFAIAGTYAATNCDGAPTTSTEFYTSCIETETIHPIDPKFLSGVCLPVVELETVFPAEGESVELSETDSSKFNAIVAAESVPFVVYGKTPEGTYMKMLMSGMYFSSMGMFGCRLLFMEYSLANVSGAWVLSSSRE